jgi:hypothetical protein
MREVGHLVAAFDMKCVWALPFVFALPGSLLACGPEALEHNLPVSLAANLQT